MNKPARRFQGSRPDEVCDSTYPIIRLRGKTLAAIEERARYTEKGNKANAQAISRILQLYLNAVAEGQEKLKGVLTKGEWEYLYDRVAGSRSDVIEPSAQQLFSLAKNAGIVEETRWGFKRDDLLKKIKEFDILMVIALFDAVEQVLSERQEDALDMRTVYTRKALQMLRNSWG